MNWSLPMVDQSPSRLSRKGSDGRCVPRMARKRQPGHRRPGIFLRTAIMLACLIATPAWAQEDPATGEKQELPAAELISLSVQDTTTIVSAQPITEVLVANPGVVAVEAVSPVKLLVSGLQYGRTTLSLKLEGGETQTYVVSVGMDITILQATIEKLSPYSQVKATSVMDTVVLTGNVPDVETSNRIMDIAGIYSAKVQNHMQVAGVQQVQLRVTIAEVSRAVTRALGVNLQAGGGTAFGGSMIGGLQPLSVGHPDGTIVGGNMPFTTTGGDQLVSSSITLYGGLSRGNLELFLRTMEQNNLTQVLAEPTLLTLSGREATFLAGGEFPIPVAQEANSVTVEFREFGVRLSFTPTVLSGQLIRLEVAPEVSEPDFTNVVQIAGFSIPGRRVRNAHTTIELGSGQTFAIAGLLRTDMRAVATRVPWLGNLPVLGAMFRSVEYRKDETELLIIVTPELVEPLNPDQLAMIPGANLLEPNNFRLYGLGQIENTREAPVQRLQRGALLGQDPARFKGAWGPTDREEGN